MCAGILFSFLSPVDLWVSVLRLIDMNEDTQEMPLIKKSARYDPNTSTVERAFKLLPSHNQESQPSRGTK